MSTSNTRSAREAHSEVMRELGVRRRCYTRWVQDGKLSDIDAHDRLERLEKAADILEKVILLESVPVSVVRAEVSDYVAAKDNAEEREKERGGNAFA